jgi:hypothetical protein
MLIWTGLDMMMEKPFFRSETSPTLCALQEPSPGLLILVGLVLCLT